MTGIRRGEKHQAFFERGPSESLERAPAHTVDRSFFSAQRVSPDLGQPCLHTFSAMLVWGLHILLFRRTKERHQGDPDVPWAAQYIEG